MATQFQTPKIYAYREINTGKYKTTRHYQLEHKENVLNQPSKRLNISENRKFAISKPDFWVKTHDGEKWSKNMLTGLFPTTSNDTYYGDINKRQHLLIFHFLDDDDLLFIYLFENFYTRNLTQVLEYIKTSYITTE